ncbi:hypothetical protein GWO43_27740 [candidate division KSB1 bacterium]|nr:hypothetical protein [candidate division KSB1 bacterium]NIV70261.1 hypothetical protein [Phycisphaerae bacterium]NIR71660.1 hypothetical protein [candidate division KSB1 bacterium]NIT74585.1 hypothetical protein [candidate division KSB1 bacterium]NIU24083.1 hypothetical protein [candidate division KSB1 bacterium]
MLHVRTSSGVWETFCAQILAFLQASLIELKIEEETVRGFRSPDSPALWIRDHSDMLRGGKHIEPDVLSTINCFAGMQAANGRIFDHVSTEPSAERENWERWVRVPVEADVEYRFVKAAYLAWQSSGDNEWLKTLLSALDRALTYTHTHPLRWDSQHKLVKRPYTIDTWDFDYTAGRADWLNFQITDDTFWGIFHGDNSGFYEAAWLLSKMYTSVGNVSAASRWQEIALGLRQRANDLLFNGRFYTHFHKLTPVTIDGVDEKEQLSLSTPMAINRGLATHEMAVAILKEYQHRRRNTGAFAEWFGIDPPFPDGIFGDDKLTGGAYINGGIFPLVGGELARAAFEHGFEHYGHQTLEQYRRMIAEHGATYLWYFPNGDPSSEETSTSPEAMPTDGWGSSAMLYAFIEGLAGIEDLEDSFRKVRCSPRWISANEDEIHIKVGYAASQASFGYQFYHLKQDSQIKLILESENSNLILNLLLPADTECTSVTWNGDRVDFELIKVGDSPYVVTQGKVAKQAEVEISYARSRN